MSESDIVEKLRAPLGVMQCEVSHGPAPENKLERRWLLALEAAAEITALRAEVARLREALKLFAQYGTTASFHGLDVETPVSLVVEPHIVWLEDTLKVWDFYAARAALEDKP